MPDLAPDVREFLATPGRYATLATIDADGSPLQAVIWYALEADGTVLINSLEGRRWPANLLRDPRASLTVEDGYDYVSMRGTAEHLHDGEAASRDIERLARLYATGDDLERKLAGFRGQRRVSFRFHPRSALRHS
ncbi:MAG: TIGR03618 family F420-dependent PPOX class oxidoreductase [Chloroflexota bacterium]